ncbi:DUF5719 family protein [Nocardioides sp. URHA0032]|uniref:DUF5719 family protein n=1 Tax=Nocardioides sp. URHA0032 TaxID=1380388 RepID=UPI00048D1498|nr:DUF5719 family protein [Nocardioides sp. URHA0032]
MSHSAPAGRRATSRLNLTTLLAVVLPVVCALALLLVRPSEPADTAAAPALTALTRSTVVCPSGSSAVSISSAAEGVDGPVQVGLGSDKKEAQVASGRTTSLDAGDGPVAVYGEDDTAPGLVAARFGTDQPAVASCVPPAAHSWFTGVGAGAAHTSILELTNPDSGTAVADVTVYGRHGVVDAPRLRGISVTGGSSVRLDLSSIVPRRDELALEVVAARGRVGATILDRYDPLGRGRTTQDWLTAQADPATANLLLGIAPGSDARRALVVANGGSDEVRATIQVVTEESVFTPKGVPDLRIPPESAGKLNLSAALADIVKKGDVTGLLVTANEPVTASLRSYAEGDLSHAVPGPVVDGPSTVLLPAGTKGEERTLLLAGAAGAGTVDVVARTASGEELHDVKVDVSPDHGITVALPAGAELVTVTPTGTTISGAVLITDDGAAAVPLTVPAMNGLVPAVRPGLP